MINNFIVFPTIQKETNKLKQKSPANAGLSETINLLCQNFQEFFRGIGR